MAAKTEVPGLIASDVDRVRKPLAQAWTLPRAAYIDPQIYALEDERIMRRSWLPLARVEQVPEPGSYLTTQLLDQPVLIVHGQDGEIRVMSSICLHRGANIIQGNGTKHVFTCPYHAWCYDTQGQLVRAPLMGDACDFNTENQRLPQIRSEVWQGFVMATLDDEAAPFADQIPGFNQYFAPFQLDKMVLVDTLEFDSRWNWKVLVENFMEAYHHIATHAHTFEPVFHAADSRVPDNDGPWSILHMPAADPRHNDSSPLPSVPGLEDWQATDLFAAVIYPHFLLGIQGNLVAWYQVLPNAVDNLTLRIHLLVPASSTELPGFDEIRKGMREMVSAIHHEDIGANDLVWQGLNSPLSRQGRLSPLEKSIWQQNQWWLDKMANG